MIRRSLALAVLATLTLGACKKDQEATTTPAATSPAATSPAAAEAPAAAPVAPPEAPAAAPVASADSLGIPACDDYLAKYEACISTKVPEASRPALQQSMQMTRDGWKQAIAAGGKDQLAAACETMREQARSSMSAYGCTDF